MGMPSYSVNTSNLNLVIEDTDYAYKGLGPEIRTTRVYNGADNTWNFSYDSSISQAQCPTSVLLKKGSGQGLTYTGTLCSGGELLSPPIELSPPSGFYDRLTWYGDYYLLVEKETSNTYRYDKVPDTNPVLYRFASITDANGNTVRINRNTSGTISAITDASERSTTFIYDSKDRCTGMTTPDGKTATYEYDTAGGMVKTTDLAGYVTTYVYKSNRISSMTFDGKTTTFTYSTSGGWYHISAIKDARGNTTNYEVVTADPRVIRVTDPRGKSTTYGSAGSFTSSSTDPLGNITSITYTNGFPTGIIDAKGATTLSEYDARGNMTKQTDPLGNVTSFVYDASDNLLSNTNALNEKWTFTYDGKGNLTKSRSPMGFETQYAYNTKGQLTSTTNPLSKTTSFTYDAFGNLAQITDPLGKSTTLGYDQKGLNPTSFADANGNTSLFEYDNNRRLTKTTFPDGTYKGYGHACCAVSSATDENGNCTSYTTDAMSYITSITDPLEKTINNAYDGNSNRTSISDQLSRTASFAYDEANRTTTITNPAGQAVTINYDKNGNLTAVHDALSNTTEFTYDGNNRILSSKDSLNKAISVTRNSANRISSTTNARGKKVTIAHDQDGRLTGKSYEGGGGVAFGYDSAGNLTSVADSTGTVAYTYNGRGQVTRVDYPGGLSIAFTYDDAGNTTSVIYPGGLTVNYAYNNRNRIKTVSWDNNAISYVYDGVGNLLTETRANNAASTYTYDANNRITAVEHKTGTTPFALMSYTRDAAGVTTKETLTLPVEPVFPDSAITGSYNDANQFVAWGDSQYTFDEDGNLTAVSGSVPFAAVYDIENRPTKITVGVVTADHTYDGIGRRVQKIVGSKTTNYRYDHLGRLMFETDDQGNVIASYIYAKARIVAMKTSGNSFFYHSDKLGSTISLTDKDGNIANAYIYEPHGKILNQSGSIRNPFTYVGTFGVMDEGNNIYFMKHRYYDANTGRFLQRDPIGIEGGLNLYAYVGNNPIESIDPQGLMDGDYIGGMGSGGNGWKAPYATQECYSTTSSQEAKTWYSDRAWDYTSDILYLGDKLLYLGDKLMNYSKTFLGTIYSGGKIGYYWATGESGRATLEVLKLVAGTVAGPHVGLALDVYQDVVEAAVEQMAETSKTERSLQNKYGDIPMPGNKRF